jgi:Flp pilus assembly CpaE family ATPase
MAVFFISTSGDFDELAELEEQIREEVPNVSRIRSVEELTGEIASRPQVSNNTDIILFPLAHEDSLLFERILGIAARHRDRLFFILISDVVTAAEYKQLIRTGGADCVSWGRAPQEIRDILAHRAGHAAAAEQSRVKPTIVAFVPGGGGVGTSTLAIETAVQLKTIKKSRERRICLIDLDFQSSHVCDLLDLEPRLHIEELCKHPDRLDAHLFEQYLSRHATELDVLAAPRSKVDPSEVNISVLDALFSMISHRYDLVLLDMPVPWFAWTRQVLGAVDLAIVVGLNNIPRLRQVAETREMIRALNPAPLQSTVVLNRCETRLLGGAVQGQYAKRIVGPETIHYIREDAEAASQAANTGIPVSTAYPSSALAKDVAAIAERVSVLKPKRATAAT